MKKFASCFEGIGEKARGGGANGTLLDGGAGGQGGTSSGTRPGGRGYCGGGGGRAGGSSYIEPSATQFQ
jgi:hypothetical protein